jgi:hypothetical protein
MEGDRDSDSVPASPRWSVTLDVPKLMLANTSACVHDDASRIGQF